MLNSLFCNIVLKIRFFKYLKDIMLVKGYLKIFFLNLFSSQNTHFFFFFLLHNSRVNSYLVFVRASAIS